MNAKYLSQLDGAIPFTEPSIPPPEECFSIILALTQAYPIAGIVLFISSITLIGFKRWRTGFIGLLIVAIVARFYFLLELSVDSADVCDWHEEIIARDVFVVASAYAMSIVYSVLALRTILLRRTKV